MIKIVEDLDQARAESVNHNIVIFDSRNDKAPQVCVATASHEIFEELLIHFLAEIQNVTEQEGLQILVIQGYTDQEMYDEISLWLSIPSIKGE